MFCTVSMGDQLYSYVGSTSVLPVGNTSIFSVSFWIGDYPTQTLILFLQGAIKIVKQVTAINQVQEKCNSVLLFFQLLFLRNKILCTTYMLFKLFQGQDNL